MFFRTFHFVDAAFLVLFFFPSWEKRNGTNDGNLVCDSSFKIFILVCAKVYFSSTLLMECCQELGVLRGRTPSAVLLYSYLSYFSIFMVVLVITEVKSNSQHSNVKSQFFSTYSYQLCLFNWSFPLDFELKHTGEYSQYTAERLGSRKLFPCLWCTRNLGMWGFSLLPDISSPPSLQLQGKQHFILCSSEAAAPLPFFSSLRCSWGRKALKGLF